MVLLRLHLQRIPWLQLRFLDFVKESKKTQIKAAMLSGKLIDAQGVEDLAKLPSTEVLLAQVT